MCSRALQGGNRLRCTETSPGRASEGLLVTPEGHALRTARPPTLSAAKVPKEDDTIHQGSTTELSQYCPAQPAASPAAAQLKPLHTSIYYYIKLYYKLIILFLPGVQIARHMLKDTQQIKVRTILSGSNITRKINEITPFFF